ncbi:sensor histidine kinase [Microbacterium jejuense]|uniref:sensor histidine kinase n=1 Tax=Microbacterium jejuense TaxID=1263637 RepID=UPI0031E7D971
MERTSGPAPRNAVTATTVALLALPMIGIGVVGVAASSSGAAWLTFAIAIAIPALVLGPAVAWRTGLSVGTALAAAGLGIVVAAATDTYLRGAAAVGLPTPAVLIATSAGWWMVLYAPWVWVLLLFPTGRFENVFDRVTAWTVVGVGVVFDLLVVVAPDAYPAPFAEAPHPWGVLPGAGVVALALLPLFLACLVASAVSTLLRYRRATGIMRRRLRWLVIAAAVVPLALLACWASYLLWGGTDAVLAAIAAFCFAIPLSIGAALLTADADVDLWIVRVVSWCVLLLAVLGVVAAATALADLVPTSGAVAIASVASAVAVLTVMLLRRPLERATAAVLFPRAERTVDALRRLLADVHRGAAPPERVVAVLRSGLGDPELTVEFAPVVDPGPGRSPEGCDMPTAVKIGGARIATIVRADQGVPQRIVDAAAPLIELVRQRAQLARALREAEQSRRRLMTAETDERRRLERDLHDGAQQRLVSLGMSLRLAQRRETRGELDIAHALDEAVAAVAASIAELRAVAHGLRPSRLDDGLAAALADLSSASAVPVEVGLDLQEIPDVVATTAYYVASEGIANAIKHAHAAQVSVSVIRAGEFLRVRVTDDGTGGATARPGGGLAGLADRVRAVGGALRIDSLTGAGTALEADLPCAS